MITERQLQKQRAEQLERKAEMIQYLESVGEWCDHCTHYDKIREETEGTGFCILRNILGPENLCLHFELYGDPEVWGEEIEETEEMRGEK
jgi:hypothetical protein